MSGNEGLEGEDVQPLDEDAGEYGKYEWDGFEKDWEQVIEDDSEPECCSDPECRYCHPEGPDED